MSQPIPGWVYRVSLLVGINALAWNTVRTDKEYHKGYQHRIPGYVYYNMAVFGGWPVGYASMYYYDHKRDDSEFRRNYAIAAACNVAFMGGLAFLRNYRGGAYRTALLQFLQRQAERLPGKSTSTTTPAQPNTTLTRSFVFKPLPAQKPFTSSPPATKTDLPTPPTQQRTTTPTNTPNSSPPEK